MSLFNLMKKKKTVTKAETDISEDFNPFDISSLVNYYKTNNPKATETDVLNFITKLSEPEEDQEHLTAEGDLPWGWFQVHDKDIDPIKTEYKKLWQFWFDNRTNSPCVRVESLKPLVQFMVETKKLCKEKGECFNYWRDILFTNEFLKDRKEELKELENNLQELENAYQKKMAIERDLVPILGSKLLSIIESDPGIMQKDIYKMFDPEARSYIQSELYSAEKACKIKREKSGNSYKCFKI